MGDGGDVLRRKLVLSAAARHPADPDDPGAAAPGLADRRVCTQASVLGGFVGYAIGYFLLDAVGRPVLEFYHAMGRYEALKSAFAQWGAWIIILKGLTPIPFKLVTIASGVAQFDLLAFALASLVSRSLRFFLLAALLWWFGDPVREFIERRLMLVTSAFALALVGGFLVLRYL